MPENRKQDLLDKINQLEEDNCIITVTEQHSYLPAMFRRGQDYQIYFNQFSPFEPWDDVTDLIETFESYIHEETFRKYKIISYEEFCQIKLEGIRKDISERLQHIHQQENDTLQHIINDVERDYGTYILINNRVKYLCAAVTSDEDWYFLCLEQGKCNEINVILESCVSGYIPLHRYLPAEEYRRITDYVIEDVISDKNIEKTSAWLYRKIISSTDFVPFTNVCLKQGQLWILEEFTPPFNTSTKCR